MTTPSDEPRFDPNALVDKWLPVWDELRVHEPRDDDCARAPLCRRHVQLPERRPAHGPRRGVQHRRRGRALRDDARLRRAAPDRLGLLRPARGERCAEARHGPARVDLREHRDAGRVVQAAGHLVRLAHAAAHLRPGVLPLDAVAVPAVLRARPGLPQVGAGQLVPDRPDRAGQRAGHRGQVRALRHRGHEAEPDPVVLPHHRLRRPAAGRHGAAGRQAGRTAC